MEAEKGTTSCLELALRVWALRVRVVLTSVNWQCHRFYVMVDVGWC